MSKNELHSEFIKDIFALTNGDKFSINKTAYLIIGIIDKTKSFYAFDTSQILRSVEKLKKELLNILNNYAQPEFLALDIEWVELEKEQEVLVLSIPPHGRLISLSKDLHGLEKKGTVYYRQGESIRIASADVIKDFEEAFLKNKNKGKVIINQTHSGSGDNIARDKNIYNIQTLENEKNKAKDNFISTIITLSNEYEKISLNLLVNMEHLSKKVELGTQNDNEGTKIQMSINASALELRVKVTELLNNTQNPKYQEQQINELRNASETIYKNIASMINNKGGSLSILSKSIEEFTKIKNRLL